MDFIRIRATLWRFRFLIAILALLATVSSVLSALRESHPAMARVVVADRDLSPGTELSAKDVRIANVPRAIAPKGVLASVGDVDGRTLTTPVPEGIPVASKMLLSNEFLAGVDPGHVVVPITVEVDGTQSLLTPGRKVALYAPKADSQSPEAVEVVDRATVVGFGKPVKGSVLSRDSANTMPLFLAVPENAATLVVGYGSTTPMRVVIIR